MDENHTKHRGLLLRTAEGEVVGSGAATEAGEQLDAGSFVSFGGDAVLIRSPIITQAGPTLLRCPVCLGRRPEEAMFECAHCNKPVCGECRDTVREHWCVRCANSQREVILRFVPDPAQEEEFLLLLKTDLLGDDWEEKIPWSLAPTPPAKPGAGTEPEEDDEWDQMPSGVNAEEDGEEEVEDLNWGQRLFQATFPKEVWAVLREPFETEIREGNGVRLRLEGLPPALAGLPWEQLTFADHPPAYDPRTTIVRWYSDEMRRAVLKPISAPLRVLVMTTAPQADTTDEEREPDYQTTREFEARHASLSEVRETSRLVLENLELPAIPDTVISEGSYLQTRESLRAALQEQEYHVLHIAGSLDWQDGSAPYLRWHANGQGAVEVSLEQFSLWLEDSPVQLIVWSGGLLHNSEWRSVLTQEGRVVRALLQGNVVGLVAPRESLDPELMQQFVVTLYTRLADESDLEAAVAAARRALVSNLTDDPHLSWSVPLLIRRAWDGHFLNFQPSAEAEEGEPPEVYDRLIEEAVDDVVIAEAPHQLGKIVEQIKERHLQIIVGETDAVPYEVGRQAARKLAEENASRLTLRYPRYEPLEDFLYYARSVRPMVTLLLDKASLEPISSEMDALLELAQRCQLYLLITSTDEAMVKGDSGVARWLSSRTQLLTSVKGGDYSPEAIRHMLQRQVEEAHADGLLDSTTFVFLKEKAADEHAFASLEEVLRLPGQITRLLHGPLTGKREVCNDETLKSAIREATIAPETIRRWFTSELVLSEKVLVMVLALLPGLPIHLLAPIYQAIVNQLRQAFHLDLAVLPVRAHLRGWHLYLFEVRRRQESGDKAGFVEFRSAQHALEILDILRQEYAEWLTETLPVFEQVLLGQGPLERVEGMRDPDTDLHLARTAVARALGAIAMRSSRSLRQVVKHLEQVLAEAPPGEHSRPQWDILSMPGHVFAHVTETDNEALQGLIRSVLNEWRQHRELNYRLASASAYGRLARRMPPERLISPLFVTAREAQAAAGRAIRSQQRKAPTRSETASVSRQSSEAVRRAVAHSLRWFPTTALPALSDLYELLAADHDLRTRANVAVALARTTEDPTLVTQWLQRWIARNNWHMWWTAAASTVTLFETGRLEVEVARSLLWQLVLSADYLADRQHKSPQHLGQDLAWAMNTCLARADDLPEVHPTLKRTLRVLIESFGRDGRVDAVLRGTFTRLAETGEHTRPALRRVLLEVLLEWLEPKAYQLEATPRQLAAEVLIESGELRRPPAQRRLRALAEFESFDYRWVQDRPLDTLSLPHLGVGGAILQTLLAGDDTTLINTLPFLHQIASLGSNEALRTLSPFVLANLGLEQPPLLSTVLGSLRKWVATPQSPLQTSAIDGALDLYRFLPAERAGDALDILFTVAGQGSLKSCDYLRARLPDIARFDPASATDLEQVLSARLTIPAQGMH